MSTYGKTKPPTYAQVATARVDPVVAFTQPHFMGMLVAAAVYFIEAIPWAGTAYLWLLNHAGIAETMILGMEAPRFISLTLAVVLLLMSGFHFSAEADPTRRELIRRRRFFWVPLWGRTWPFGDIRYVSMKNPYASSSGALKNPVDDDSIAYGAYIILFDILMYLVAVFWDLFTPYQLYIVTKDRDCHVIGSGMNRNRLGDIGRDLARTANTRFS